LPFALLFRARFTPYRPPPEKQGCIDASQQQVKRPSRRLFRNILFKIEAQNALKTNNETYSHKAVFKIKIRHSRIFNKYISKKFTFF
jgi:hypothetical protein